MRVYFRTDSSASIGGGHMGRCLALAQALRRNDHQVGFLSAAAEGNMNHLASEAGFDLVELDPVDWGARDAADEDARRTVAALRGVRPDWMVVDSYAIRDGWEDRLRSSAGSLLVLDDLADRPHACDLLVDSNRGDGAAYAGLVPDDCQVLAGPEFALLRREFRDARRLRGGERGKAGTSRLNVLVCFGAVDRLGMTRRTAEAIMAIEDRPFETHIVVTSANARWRGLVERFRDVADVHVHKDVADMSALLAEMDLAVGAGGVSAWERCCMAVPSLTIRMADNQRHVVETAARHGALVDLGGPEDANAARLTSEITALVEDRGRREAMAVAGARLVDGLGARRVAAFMEPMSVRVATAHDARLLWNWANHPDVRSNAFSPEPIEWDRHLAWLTEKLSTENSRIYIGSVDGVPVAQVRIDADADEAVIDVSVDAGRYGRGFGGTLLVRAMHAFRNEIPGVPFVARIKAANRASRRLFASVGFQRRAAAEPDVVTMEMLDSSTPA